MLLHRPLRGTGVDVSTASNRNTDMVTKTTPFYTLGKHKTLRNRPWLTSHPNCGDWDAVLLGDGRVLTAYSGPPCGLWGDTKQGLSHKLSYLSNRIFVIIGHMPICTWSCLFVMFQLWCSAGSSYILQTQKMWVRIKPTMLTRTRHLLSYDIPDIFRYKLGIFE